MGHIEDGHLLTTGEKALVVMLVAGVFGYWAGFNLSALGIADPFPVASAAAAAQPGGPSAPAMKSEDRTSAESAPRDDPPAPAF